MIVKRGETIIPADNNLHLLDRVEVWDAAYGRKSNRKVANLVPMHPNRFADRKAAGAFKPNATGVPFYFTHTDTGIEFHPACDKDYWFEPVLRKAVI